MTGSAHNHRTGQKILGLTNLTVEEQLQWKKKTFEYVIALDFCPQTLHYKLFRDLTMICRKNDTRQANLFNIHMSTLILHFFVILSDKTSGDE